MLGWTLNGKNNTEKTVVGVSMARVYVVEKRNIYWCTYL